jgi:hypothetical protein
MARKTVVSKQPKAAAAPVAPKPPAVAVPAPPKPAEPAAALEAIAEPPATEGSDDAASAAAADFAAAFAAAPNPSAGSFSEVIVRVSPLGAQIYDGPKLLAQTAAKVPVAKGQKKTLVVHLEGYQSRRVLVDGSSESVNIVMLPVAGVAKPVDNAAASSPAPLERSFIVQSQQQRAAEAAPKAPKKEPSSSDILPPL